MIIKYQCHTCIFLNTAELAQVTMCTECLLGDMQSWSIKCFNFIYIVIMSKKLLGKKAPLFHIL